MSGPTPFLGLGPLTAAPEDDAAVLFVELSFAAVIFAIMPLREDFREKAEECLRIATDPTTDKVAAALFRLLADDYLAMAKTTSQQQQQIQPKGPEPEDK
jgi:hypothetical protein